MSCALMPYAISFSLLNSPCFSSFSSVSSFLVGSSGIVTTPFRVRYWLGVSHPVQMKLFPLGEVTLAPDPPFPGTNHRYCIGQDAKRVQRRHHWYTKHVTQGQEHERGLQFSPLFPGLLLELERDHPVEKLADVVKPTSCGRHCNYTHVSAIPGRGRMP